MMMNETEVKWRDYSLYVHIPFCLKKCAYCDFYSVCDCSLAETYIDAVCKQIQTEAMRMRYRRCITVFIGGGTPTSLDITLLTKLLKAIRKHNITKGTEFTVEANPATVDIEKLKLLKKYGVNRLSIGLQSINDDELSMLTRIHSFDDFLQTYDIATKCFDNINIDIMYGLPACKSKDPDKKPTPPSEYLERTLEKTVELKPAHISFYGLRIEPGTPFDKNKNKLLLPEDEEFARMYIYGTDYLTNHGYHKYEISNFSLPGKECKHNLVYWKRGDYLGIGPSAHSFINDTRYSYPKDINLYIEKIKNGYAPKHSDYEYIAGDDAVNEVVMLSLRLTSGLDLDYLKEKFNKDFMEDFGDIVENYESYGYIRREGNRLILTDRGMLVSNYIISDMFY